MKIDQTVAGALLDFIYAAENDPHPIITLSVFLREWAADRGLDLNQANVEWNQDLGKEIGTVYHQLPYEQRILQRYGDMRGTKP